MEMADLIAITKADRGNREMADLARVQYQNALHLYPLPASGWTPQVTTCSSLENEGIDDVWNIIETYLTHVKGNGYFKVRRKEQARYWMMETILENLKSDFFGLEEVEQEMQRLEEEVLSQRCTSFQAARRLMEIYHSRKSPRND
jgi:LAO/AO transport system kinase